MARLLDFSGRQHLGTCWRGFAFSLFPPRTGVRSLILVRYLQQVGVEGWGLLVVFEDPFCPLLSEVEV